MNETQDTDTETNCFKEMAIYMKKHDISEIHFYIDENGDVNCDAVVKTIYKSDK
jgi:hypothetical protein